MEERIKYLEAKVEQLEKENKCLHQYIQEESQKAAQASSKAFVAWYNELNSEGCRNA